MGEENSNSNQSSRRTSFSLVASTLLHGTVIALVAIGPAFLPDLKLNHSDPTSNVSFETVEITESQPMTIADHQSVVVPETPTAPPQVAPVAPQPQVVKVAPLPTPVAATTKSLPPKPAKKIVQIDMTKPSSALPEKEEINSELEPQPIVSISDDNQEAIEIAKNEEAKEFIAAQPSAAEPVTNTETVEQTNETAQTSLTEQTTETAQTTQAEEAPQTAVAEPEAFASATQEDLPAPVIKSQSPVEVVASQSGTQAAQSNTGGQQLAETPAPVKVTQNYIGLKQLPGNKPPSYTRDMRLTKAQGKGQLVYFVNKDGTVSQIQLTRSTGAANLDQAAVSAFSKYRFVPGQEGYTVHDFEFRLEGPEAIEAGRLRTTMNQ